MIALKSDISFLQCLEVSLSDVTGGALHLHDYSIIPIDFVVYNVTYSDQLYLCQDDPNRNGEMRYGWFSWGESNSDCSWIKINQARMEWGTQMVNDMITKSLQFTSNDAPLLSVTSDMDEVWKKFEAKVMALRYHPIIRQSVHSG